MTQRLSYEDSIVRLREIGWLGEDCPPMPDHPPIFDDPEPLGFSFFRTRAADDDLSGLTLARTYFAKSEINAMSFANTDLSESTMCWNDFLRVNFSGASLAAADMRASLYENCNFDDADLSGADLRLSSFDGCTFANTNVAGAKLSQDQRANIALSDHQFGTIDWLDAGDEPPGG